MILAENMEENSGYKKNIPLLKRIKNFLAIFLV